MTEQHMTAWDHAEAVARGTLDKAQAAVAAEVKVVAEHNVETPAKIVEAVKHEASVLVEHNVPKAEEAVKGDALSILHAAEQEAAAIQRDAEVAAKLEAHNAATKIEAHAGTLEGGLADALKAFAHKLRTGEEKLVDEVKAELEKIGVKF